MAEKTDLTKKISKLEAENKRLKLENQMLQNSKSVPKNKGGTWRRVGAIIFGSFAVALLVVGSLLFWAGNTLVKNDRFVETVSPIIKNHEVQTAVAGYTTERLYQNFNAEQYISEALPPRAEFLAPTLTAQLHSQTENILMKVLSSSAFQQKWNQLLTRAHGQFISTIKSHGSDGTFSISELYQELSNSLQDTQLSFLAGRQLPSKIGSIQVINGNWISTAYTVINNIDLWRTLAILLFFACAALCIYLSKKRRLALIRLAFISTLALFAVLVSVRVFREAVAGSAAPEFTEAIRQTTQIIFHPLVVQIMTLMALLILIALTAWMSGPGRSAQAVRFRANQLLSGKLHQAIFAKENSFSIWLGRHKRTLQCLAVAMVAIATLFTRLTPAMLITYVIVLVIVMILVETLAASSQKPASKR